MKTEQYKDLDDASPITEYCVGENEITVYYGKAAYVWKYIEGRDPESKKDDIAMMQQKAKEGRGLAGFINSNKEIKHGFENKF